ncbi:MAG: nitroreductase [Deltaproteobacteria bacterium]|nr:nitroreductase [Deltaproteobacteria bacterium]
MNTLDAIAQRRSIRKFKDAPVPDEIIVRVLNAAIQAPSGKNRQPWRFIVVKQDKRPEMVRIMREAIGALKAEGVGMGSSEWTAGIMEQAPITLFVFNAYEENVDRERTSLMNVVDVQSIGAAIQNLLLAAQDLGLGTLWICDVFYAYDELCVWLGETHQMIAAVALGYPDEQPPARPRQSVHEVTRWL